MTSTLKEIKEVYWQEIWKWKRPPKIKNIIMEDKKINHLIINERKFTK